MGPMNIARTGISGLVISFLYLSPVCADESFFDALSGGKLDFLLNYRFENVNDPTTAKDAYASTLRTVLGYQTARFYGFNAHLEIEDVRVIGNELYNDGGANGKTRYAVVIDPEGTEINQAYLSFGRIQGTPVLENTEFKAGRQLITYRKAPFHRFIGPVVWRQNWQTFDGYTINNQSLPDARINFGYIYNINRIFGEDNKTPGLADQGLDGYLFNIQYDGLSLGQLEGYSYLLDFDEKAPVASAFFQSTRTIGGRFYGSHAIRQDTDILYAIEIAHQSDYSSNKNDISSNYFLAELGANFKNVYLFDLITVKLTHERLEGDGGADRFTTPLATLHPYQGWADKFLNTPGDGILDNYITLIASLYGFKFTAVYHDFNSDNDNYDYGNELDLLLDKDLGKHVSAGLKYATYESDKNSINTSRNPIQSTDIDKFWFYISFRY